MTVIVKMMGSEDAPDSDTRKTYKLFTDVVTAEFERECDSAFVVLRFREYHRVGEVSAAGVSEPERFELQGNVYVMNEDGKTISSFGISPIPNANTNAPHIHVHGASDVRAFKESQSALRDGPIAAEEATDKRVLVRVNLLGKPKYISAGWHDGLQLRQLLGLPPDSPLSYWISDAEANVARWEEVHPDGQLLVSKGLAFFPGYGHIGGHRPDAKVVQKIASLAMGEKHSDPDRTRRAFGEFDSESAPGATEKVVRQTDRERVPMKEQVQVSCNGIPHHVTLGAHTGAWLRKKFGVEDAHGLYRSRGKQFSAIEVMRKDSVNVNAGMEFFTAVIPGGSA